MSISSPAARSLAALGHDARLNIFRALVKAGHDGLTIGQIAGHAGLAASTLAHHLRTLVDAGLVTQEKHGREVVNRVDFDEMHRILDFLTSECCTGVVLTGEDKAA
ncbi:MAG: winged helix-turn-helix transcriptional regulator [Rhizobiales bacterium]|nr:winged helix-turn-helix transcriptional regulator [Hyphomicrobiales bacterium]